MKKTVISALDNIISEDTLIVCLNNNNSVSERIEQQLTAYLNDFVPSRIIAEKYFDLDGILLRLLNDTSTKTILFILPIDFGEKIGTLEFIDPADLSNFVSSRIVTLQVLLGLLKRQKKCYVLGIQAGTPDMDESNKKSITKLDEKVKELAEVLHNIITKKLEKEE